MIILSQESATIMDGVTLTSGGSIAGFLSDLERRSGTANPFRIQTRPMIEAVVSTVLPNMLTENGFENLEAVIHWTKCHKYVHNEL